MIEAEEFPFGFLRGKASGGDAKEVGEILSPGTCPLFYAVLNPLRTCWLNTVLQHASASPQVVCKNSDVRGSTFVGGALPNHWKS